jgi:hypothetical protein
MMKRITRDDFRIHLGNKPVECWNSLRSGRKTRDHSPRSILENAIERYDPVARGTKAKRMSAGCIRGHHSANRTELTARRIDGETQTTVVRGTIHVSSKRARPCPDRMTHEIDVVDRVHAAQIDNHTRPDCAVAHARAGTARYERQRALPRPIHQRDYIIGIDWYGHRRGNDPPDAR